MHGPGLGARRRRRAAGRHARPTIRWPRSEGAAPERRWSDEDLILLEDGHCLREHALAACGLKPPKPPPARSGFAATSLPTLVQMVGSGLGVTFLPAMAVDGGPDRRRPGRRPPDRRRPHPSREIVVAWRAGSSRGAEGRLLAEVLRE